ncbi:serine hydrolase FSH [Usnea florida]
MPSLKFLCLHGAGTREDILESQMRGLIHNLEKDNSASFVYVGGETSCGPGPGIEQIYEGPFYSYYNWPRRLDNQDDDEQSMQRAYKLLDDIIDTEGPFDGILGFSHGATLAFAFLVHHASKHAWGPMPVRCAVFFSAMPPFQLDKEDRFVYDQGLRKLSIPSVHVVGKSDFVREHSLKLYALCDPATTTLVVHSKGHEIPADEKNVSLINQALRELGHRTMFG